MATSLTAIGLVWATLSLAAALLCCTGFYLPFWIQGRLLGRVDAYFSSFRRCNYPRVNSQGGVEIVEECGRYTRFWDIPSPWWQASTVLVGTGSALSLLIAVTAAAAFCITYVVHAGTAKVAGSVQLAAAMLVIVGGAVYPVGWDSREVRDSCGNTSNIYRLGTCELSWSVYILAMAVLLLVLCFGLSFCASRVSPRQLILKLDGSMTDGLRETTYDEVLQDEDLPQTSGYRPSRALELHEDEEDSENDNRIAFIS